MIVAGSPRQLSLLFPHLPLTTLPAQLFTVEPPLLIGVEHLGGLASGGSLKIPRPTPSLVLTKNGGGTPHPIPTPHLVSGVLVGIQAPVPASLYVRPSNSSGPWPSGPPNRAWGRPQAPWAEESLRLPAPRSFDTAAPTVKGRFCLGASQSFYLKPPKKIAVCRSRKQGLPTRHREGLHMAPA